MRIYECLINQGFKEHTLYLRFDLRIELSSFACEQQMPPRGAPASEPTALDMICQLNKLKPPKFQGGVNPLRYEEWIRRLENLFEIMECPDRFKVALAMYQFEGEDEF